MTIINGSRWPITKSIAIESKMNLLNCLISEELISKRIHNIQAFKTGLTCFAVLEFCKQKYQITKELFVYDDQQHLLASSFIGLMETPSKEITPAEVNALQHFKSYITEREGNADGR